MALLTDDEVLRLRRRLSEPAFRAAVAALTATAEDALSRPVLVPPAGIAGWNHNYVCPDHAVPLAFGWDRPHAHRCPVDGRDHESPLLDAAWWRRVNTECMNGALAAALLWRATGVERYLKRSQAILLAYAERYPGYQVHGGIPCNGPGKANQQTLCEATWIIPLAWAYDLIRSGLTPGDGARIREHLLAEAGAFLVAHQEEQLHNHQCWIASAIGILGLVSDRQDFVDVALHGEWGICRQLRDGVLADGFWLEGSVGYHIHALTALLKFVQTARGSRWDLRDHAALRSMLSALRPLVQPDGTFPALGDVTNPQSLASLIPHLEIAYGWSGEPLYGSLLAEALGGRERRSLEGLLFGREQVAAGPELPVLSHYSSPGNGISILRQAEDGLYLLVKHGDGGQEHDHSDRLGLSLVGRGERLAPDIGTVLYGHALHWDWYKSTLAHNTVMIGGENQPPATAGVTEFREEADHAVLDTWAAWPATSPGGYGGARFRRIILWTAEGFVDLFRVHAGRPDRIEYLFHSPGEIAAGAGAPAPGAGLGLAGAPAPGAGPGLAGAPAPGAGLGLAGAPAPGAGPGRFLSDRMARALAGDPVALRWQFQQAALHGSFWCSAPTTLITIQTPDNPPARHRSSVILRQEGLQAALFVAAYRVTPPDATTPPSLAVTGPDEGPWAITLTTPDRSYRWQVSLPDLTAPAHIIKDM